MNFANNWSQAVALAAGATTAALSLPDGTYRLTISDAIGSSATRWEVVEAVVAAGSATLTRAQEGTTAQEWPANSIIYCTLTAGVLADAFAQIAALADRVSALESGGADQYAITVTFESWSGALGYQAGLHGSISPATANVDRTTAAAGAVGQIDQLYRYTEEASGNPFTVLRLVGTYASLASVPFSTLAIPGAFGQTLTLSRAAAQFATAGGYTTLTWSGGGELAAGTFELSWT